MVIGELTVGEGESENCGESAGGRSGQLTVDGSREGGHSKEPWRWWRDGGQLGGKAQPRWSSATPDPILWLHGSTIATNFFPLPSTLPSGRPCEWLAAMKPPPRELSRTEGSRHIPLLLTAGDPRLRRLA